MDGNTASSPPFACPDPFPMRSHPLSRLFSRRAPLPHETARSWAALPEDLRLEGERIWLRWPRLIDAEAVFAYAGDEAVSTFMDWSPHRGIEESRRFLRGLEQSRELGREVAFGIIEWSSDELVGVCSLVCQSDASVAEMGYASRRSAWGKGYMTEAARLICPWAMHYLHLREIFAEVHPDNRPSQRVLEKAGFIRQPRTVYRSIKGVRSPHYHYTYTPETEGERR